MNEGDRRLKRDRQADPPRGKANIGEISYGHGASVLFRTITKTEKLLPVLLARYQDCCSVQGEQKAKAAVLPNILDLLSAGISVAEKIQKILESSGDADIPLPLSDDEEEQQLAGMRSRKAATRPIQGLTFCHQRHVFYKHANTFDATEPKFCTTMQEGKEMTIIQVLTCQ